MQLATEIIRFFHIDHSDGAKPQSVRTIDEFSKIKPEWEKTLDLQLVFRICSQLEHYGYLVEARTQHPHPILGRAYVAPNFDERRALYGEYEFVGHGFGILREKLGPAVRPVVVTKPDGSEDIGTCFLLGNQVTIFTARHVIEGMQRVEIPDKNGAPIKIQKIIVPKDPKLDVAVIVAEAPLKDIPFFRCSDSGILDEVLCLGFPPIPGFEATLIADIATVNAEVKSSAGRIVANGESYLDQQKYFLINARVKGGNSGGPIVSRQGYVVGILVQTSMSAEDQQSLDSLGYGIATPKSEWIYLLANEAQASKGSLLPFENLPEGGFRLIK